MTRTMLLTLTCALVLLFGPGALAAPGTPRIASQPIKETNLGVYVGETVADLELAWQQLLPSTPPPHFVLFDTPIDTACGSADPGSTSFSCPADGTIYLDAFSFMARAVLYGEVVVQVTAAHYTGHVIEALLDAGVGEAAGTASQTGGVKTELAIDCLTGFLMHEIGPASGDPAPIDDATRFIQGEQSTAPHDHIQQHGTADERTLAFMQGYEMGPAGCPVT